MKLRILSSLPRAARLICLVCAFLLLIPPLQFFNNIARAVETESSSQTQRRFAIYYGWYSDNNGMVGPSLARIIESRPEFVISPMHTSTGALNLRPEIIDRLHGNEIKVMVYVATGNGFRDLDSVLDEIKEGLEAGADGVMLDEVSVLHSQSHFNYYNRIYTYSKSFGSEITVIANPGTVLVNQDVMKVSDMLFFEHQWRLAPNLDWFSDYPASRYMGISSNDISNVMGYTVNQKSALADTVEAWELGIGYHISTDKYTSLPSWFEDYQSSLDDYIENKSQVELHEIKVGTVEKDGGKAISGLWIEVRSEGRVVRTGFSPAAFVLSPGTYEISASSYQNFIFSDWDDGITSQSRTIAINGPSEFVANYRNDLVTLSFDAIDAESKTPIRGIHVLVNKDSSIVAEGYTPMRMDLPAGVYLVTPSSNQHGYSFSGWSDGSDSISKQVTLEKDSTYSAHYNNTKAITGTLLECQDINDYRMKVSQSLRELGPIGGMLEMSRQQALMRIQCGDSSQLG